MSRSDRRAFLVLCFLALLVAGYWVAVRWFPDTSPAVPLTAEERARFDAFADSLVFDTSKAVPFREVYYAVPVKVPESFPFDPNTADSTQLLRLGLPPWQVRSIYRYRAKGGRFHRPEDFARVYGMTGEVYGRLKPYIRIAEQYRWLADSLPSDTMRRDTMRYPVKLDAGSRINLNLADTTLLRRVPGIGRMYAGRIAAYRERLGGFVSLNQLAEIAELPDGVADWFFLTGTPVRRMNINRLSVEALRRHPYLNFYQSKVIVEHRRKFGPVTSLYDLSLYEEFTEVDLKRLEPYVVFE